MNNSGFGNFAIKAGIKPHRVRKIRNIRSLFVHWIEHPGVTIKMSLHI